VAEPSIARVVAAVAAVAAVVGAGRAVTVVVAAVVIYRLVYSYGSLYSTNTY
jgi:hypothetical protein